MSSAYYISPFSSWSSFLAFLSSTVTCIQPHFCTVGALFLNLLRQAAGELAFSSVDMVMRQGEKTTEPGQVSTGGSADPVAS